MTRAKSEKEKMKVVEEILQTIYRTLEIKDAILCFYTFIAFLRHTVNKILFLLFETKQKLI